MRGLHNGNRKSCGIIQGLGLSVSLSLRHLNGQESFYLSTILGPDFAGRPGRRRRPRGGRRQRRRGRRERCASAAQPTAAASPSAVARSPPPSPIYSARKYGTKPGTDSTPTTFLSSNCYLSTNIKEDVNLHTSNSIFNVNYSKMSIILIQ